MKKVFVACLLACVAVHADIYRPDGIWKAACMGDVAAVRRLLAKGSNINSADARGFTPLMHALNTFQTQAVPELLQLGADPNARDFDGVTPLALCARNADAATMRLLIAAGAKIDPRDVAKDGVVRMALRYGSAEVFQLVLDAGLDVNTKLTTSEPGEFISALQLASANGNTPVVELLVKKGADIEATGGSYATRALMFAISNDQPATVRRLVQLGARLDVTNTSDTGVLKFACYKLPTPACLNVLLDANAPLVGSHKEILGNAWSWGDASILKKLDAKGLKLPSDDPIGALLAAIRNNDLAEVKRLCATGFYHFDRDAHCVLVPAAALGNRAILDELHTHAGNGKHLSCADAAKFTQIHHAVIGGHLDALDFYLKNKAKADLADYAGRTPLMMAAMLGRVEMIERLVQAGARKTAFDERRYNALDLALLHGQTKAAAALKAHDLSPTPEIEPVAEEPALPPVPKSNGTLPMLTAALTPLSTTHEAWYQSIAATHDFAALLQAQLENESGLKWVERTEIDRAEKELTLNGSGLVSPAQSLAIGHWVKADVLLTGSLSPDQSLGRQITLRVIDALRGDVLARRTFPIQQPPAAPFTITAEILQQAGKAAREMLTEARLRIVATPQQTVVAPLFIGNRTKYTSRLDLHAARLIEVFQTAAIGKNLRVLNLHGTSDAHSEAELAVSGLAQLEGNAWQKVADHYLWGWIEETGPLTTPFAEMPVKITFELSGGQMFSADTTVSQLETAAKKLAAEVLSALPASKATDGRNAAKVLFDHATEWIAGQGNMPLGGVIPAWTLNRWRQSVKLLDAARFFAPEDGRIAARWLIERWNKAVYFSSTRETATPHHFWSLWQRKTDWDAHVARFGFKDFPAYDSDLFGRLPFASGKGAADYPKRCWHGLVAEIVRYLFNNNTSIPDGLPPDVRQRWLREMSAESTRRFMKLVSDPDVKQPLPFEDYFAGKVDLYLPLDARLEVAKVAFAEARKEKAGESPGHVIALRHHLLKHFDEAGKRDEGLAALSLSSIRVSEKSLPLMETSENPAQAAPAPLTSNPATPKSPRFDVKIQTVPLTGPWGDSRNYRVEAGFSAGAFTLLNLQYQPHRQFGNETMIAAWVPTGTKLLPLEPSPFKEQFRVDFFAEAPGVLWMSDPNRGMSRIHLPTKRIHTFKASDGVPFSHGSHGAYAGDEFFVSGEKQPDQPVIAAYHAQRGWRLVPTDWKMTSIRRLAGFGRHLYCRSDVNGRVFSLRVHDTVSKTWSVLSAPAEHSGGKADAEGLWGMTDQNVSLIRPDGGAPVSIALPVDLLDHNYAILEHDGEWLWIAAEYFRPAIPPQTGQSRKNCLLAVHKPTRSYRGCIDLPSDSSLTGLIVTPQALYALSRRPGGKDIDGNDLPHPILSIDRAALLREAAAR